VRRPAGGVSLTRRVARRIVAASQGWSGLMARPNQLKLTMPAPSEWELHKMFADCLRLEIGPPGRLSKQGALWFSIDAADSGSGTPGARVGRGIIDGVPDLFVLYRGRVYLIEIKKPLTGVLSEAQEMVLAAATLAGVPVAVVDNVDDLMRVLDAWGIPRRRRVMLQLTEPPA
jgi:hypothetical protein